MFAPGQAGPLHRCRTEGVAMRKLTLLLAPVLLAPTLLTGCQTWGPTWSELTGARYNVTIANRRPAIIDRVDDHGAFPNPNLIKVEPGRAPAGRAGSGARLGRRSAAARDDAQRRAVQALLHQRAVREHDHAGSGRRSSTTSSRSAAATVPGAKSPRSDRRPRDGGRRCSPSMACASSSRRAAARSSRCTTSRSRSRPARCWAWSASPAPASR